MNPAISRPGPNRSTGNRTVRERIAGVWVPAGGVQPPVTLRPEVVVTGEHPRPFPPDDPECELCEAARFTHWYAESENGWIADCEVCSVPMAVWWHHGTEPEEADRVALLDELGRAADDRFGAGNWQLDTTMRQVPDHFHAHARDRRWFEERWSRPLSRYTGVGGSRVTAGQPDAGPAASGS